MVIQTDSVPLSIAHQNRTDAAYTGLLGFELSLCCRCRCLSRCALVLLRRGLCIDWIDIKPNKGMMTAWVYVIVVYFNFGDPFQKATFGVHTTLQQKTATRLSSVQLPTSLVGSASRFFSVRHFILVRTQRFIRLFRCGHSSMLPLSTKSRSLLSTGRRLPFAIPIHQQHRTSSSSFPAKITLFGRENKA